MPVETLHPQYKNKQYELRQLRDTLEGPSSVKRSGALYLPIPTAMAKATKQEQTGISYDSNDLEKDGQNIVSNAPWYHSNPVYSAYVQRARFPDITSLIHRGLVGIATKNDPVFEVPENISYLEERATRCGKSLVDLYEFGISEVLATGRLNFLIDVDEETNQCVIVPYVADSFINWKKGRDEGREVFELGVFNQPTLDDEDDEFSHEEVEGHFVVRDEVTTVDQESEEEVILGVYNTQNYKDGTKQGAPKVPMLRGNPLTFVPLTVVNTNGLGVNRWVSPLTGVSDIAISIYQKDADMSNSEFMSCNPMLVFIGVNEDETPTVVGSNVSYSLGDSEADAKYVEPEARSLSHMAKRIEALFDEAVHYGVSLIGKTSNSAEAAETVKMKQSGSGATIRTIMKAVAEGIEQALQFCYMWETNATEMSDAINVELNLDLAEMQMTAQEQTAWLQSFLNNAISHETYLKRLIESGIKLSGEDADGEIAKISSQPPALADEADDEDEEDEDADPNPNDPAEDE